MSRVGRVGQVGLSHPAYQTYLPHLPNMRFIHAYLIGYFVLVFGAGLALWQAGAFSHVAPFWVVIGTLFTVGLGITLALTAEKPPITQD